MEKTFFTLQEFSSHSEGVTYVLIAAALVFFVFFWMFLSERDK